jgi:arabinan endo-1,5-alpha-L-arabinosidase
MFRTFRPRAKTSLVVYVVLAAALLALVHVSAAPGLPAMRTAAAVTAAAADPQNPALIAQPSLDRPDAFILPVPGGYYLYAGQASGSPMSLQVSFSTELGEWPPGSPALSSLPSWAAPGWTWSPDVRLFGTTYVMYFDALLNTTTVKEWPGGGAVQSQCLGLATSPTPAGPFVPADQPLFCDFAHHGVIDARSFVDPSGQAWLIYKSDDNSNPGIPNSVTHIYSQPLSADGLSLAGAATQLLQADQPWQHGLIEAPQLVAGEGVYWLFYSGGWFNQPGYAIGVAECSGPQGPCTDVSIHPWLASNAQGDGPGEGSLFTDAAGNLWMAYSPWFWQSSAHGVRPVAMVPVAFGPFGPYQAALRL